MDFSYYKSFTVSAQANVSAANVKLHGSGHSQNGQPVEFGQPLFVIG
jgi:hypothetical protein